MFDWTKLLDFVDRHARQVAISLLGILLSGTVGGALYINALTATIARLKDELDIHSRIVDERIEILDEKHRTERASLKAAKAHLEIQLKAFRQGADSLLTKVDYQDNSEENCRTSLLAIRESSISLRRSLENAEAIELISERMQSAFTAGMATAKSESPDKAHFKNGFTSMAQGDMVRAIAELQEAARLSPKNGEYFYALGKAYRAAGHNQAASEAFREARRLGYLEERDAEP